MALFEVRDIDKKIWEEELRDFLPNKIIDIHTHVYKREIIKAAAPENLPKPKLSWVSIVMNTNPIEDLDETYKLLFPGKEVTPLMFVTGKFGREENNQYLSGAAKEYGWPALYYSHPTQSADEIEEKIRSGGFLGVKSYLTLAPGYLPADEIRILDFFPKHQLERLNEMGAICMCHIPRSKRLQDKVNVQQILEIKKEFPKLRFIVAHIGRSYTKEDVGDVFDMLTTAPDTMYDFSANCCDYAIREVIKRCGVKHLMFGTDMPVLRMRTHRIEENGTYVNLVEPGLYPNPDSDPHLREVSEEEGKKITFFAYEELLAFKRVAEELNLTREDVEDIMYNNAKNLIDGARRDIYGE